MYVPTFVRSFVPPPPAHPARFEAQPAGSEAQSQLGLKPQASHLAGWASGLAVWPSGGEQTNECMNIQKKRKSADSTGLSPNGATALLPPVKTDIQRDL